MNIYDKFKARRDEQARRERLLGPAKLYKTKGKRCEMRK